MALAAHFFGHRRVDVVKEYSRRIGTMGIMTGRAACLRHGIVHMLLDENRSVRLMTPHAQDTQVIFQEVNLFCRGMRIMTGYTPFLHRVVLEFHLR